MCSGVQRRGEVNLVDYYYYYFILMEMTISCLRGATITLFSAKQIRAGGVLMTSGYWSTHTHTTCNVTLLWFPRLQCSLCFRCNEKKTCLSIRATSDCLNVYWDRSKKCVRSKKTPRKIIVISTHAKSISDCLWPPAQ